MARLLEDGLARSPSLAGLVERIGELKGLVFVRVIDRTHATSAAGGLSHNVATAGGVCMLQIALVRDYTYGDRAIAILAHEFRHAVEVLEHPEARSEAAVDRLYQQIGYVSGRGAMETDAALEMERLVAEELKHKKKGA